MKPECSEYRKQIPGLFFDDLALEERQELERHLEECPPCRAEKESYARTLTLMKLVEDQAVPRHFFVYPKESILNPWQLFCAMRPMWKILIAATVTVFILTGIATLSKLQVQSDGGRWMVRFGGAQMDAAALKEDILRTADARNRDARAEWMNGMRTELALSLTDLTQKQQSQLATSLKQLDAKFTKRVLLAEDRMKSDTEEIAGAMYRSISQRRAQDLDIINLRFDSIEANNIIKTQQTNTILDALLQEAELRLR